jgi:hypothetical protein
MTNQIEKPPRKISVEKGKRIVIAIITYLILVEVITYILLPPSGTRLFSTFGRWLITVVLSVQLYRGKNWARAMLAFWLGVGTLFGVYGIYQAFISPYTTFLGFMFILVGVALPAAISTYLLIFSSDIDEFVASRKV